MLWARSAHTLYSEVTVVYTTLLPKVACLPFGPLHRLSEAQDATHTRLDSSFLCVPSHAKQLENLDDSRDQPGIPHYNTGVKVGKACLGPRAFVYRGPRPLFASLQRFPPRQAILITLSGSWKLVLCRRPAVSR